MYALYNYAEEIIDNLLNQILDKYDNICKCDKCLLDIKAYALNHVKPKYVVTQKGATYTRALCEIDKQEKINITKSIVDAIKIVSENPHH